ncbi:hypothetical protein B0H14DRAFT_3756726 [Mycena olivaceomarginata]|nr:hypothetical protein B0H14DRAFT_3756726 [Mycena olivaceomarginata]
MAPIATVALLVLPDDLQALYEGFISNPSTPSNECRDDVLPHKASFKFAILHMAWTVTVRRWAGIDTFCVGGNYSRGVCYVHDRNIPHSALIHMNPEASLQELFHQLSGAMAANVPSVLRKVTSRSLGSYSATICLPESPRPVQKCEAMEKNAAESPVCSIEAVNMCSEHHFTQIRAFTKDNTLLHDLCLRHAKTQPNACAIDSWDGNLTYEELDNLTSQLAHHLIAQGCWKYKLEPRQLSIVSHFYFNYYFTVASCPHSFPHNHMISAALYSNFRVPCFMFLIHVIVCLPHWFASQLLLACKHPPELNSTKASIWTPLCSAVSPSPPEPLSVGIIQEHRSYATAICDYVAMLGLDASSHVLQFDNYAFDISNNDFLAPLTAGGCCSPTVAIQLGLPMLKTVCIGGEPPSRNLLHDWAGRVHLINQYGMGEVATFCAYNDSLDAVHSGIVGRAGSGTFWIASPISPEQLVPLGAVGEILIEGPHLVHGYLDGVTTKSDMGFLSRLLAWMHHIPPNRGPTRVYHSGDLGRYHADGTVEHLGRKDMTLKLNGCRVELSEVGCVLCRCLSDEDAVVVNVLGTMHTDEEPILAAFLYVGLERIGIQTIDEDHTEYPLVRGMHTIAEAQLPEHMIPSLFLLVDRIPCTKSNQTDQRRLHIYGQDFLRGEKILNCA